MCWCVTEHVRWEWREREIRISEGLSPSPSPTFIGDVGEYVLFISYGGADIYKNATMSSVERRERELRERQPPASADMLALGPPSSRLVELN